MRYLLPIALISTLLYSCATTEPASQSPTTGPSSTGNYHSIITNEAISKKGVLDVHHVKDKIYYEIPDSLFGRDFLMVNRVAAVPNNFFGFISSGSKTSEQVITFERVREKVNIRQRSNISVAPDSLPIYRSVRINNYEPILATFDIKTIGPDSTTTIIEINSFFENDVPAISGMSGFLRNMYQFRRFDATRSYIDTVRTFPQNVAVRHVMTYKAVNPPSAQNTNNISLLMNQSMILLPKEPMRPRHYDYRVGWFTINQLDFGLDEQKAGTRSLIRRWRLEPSDPDFEPEDIRYNMVRWIANTTRNAVGPSTIDPRAGEIIASDIIWYHNHIRSYRNRLILETGAANPKVQNLRVDDDYLKEAPNFDFKYRANAAFN